MQRRCFNCGWLEVNPSGVMSCGYSDERTWANESCPAWKDKKRMAWGAKIRTMTDEELAKIVLSDWCGIVCKGTTCDWKCEERILNWLKSEVGE